MNNAMDLLNDAAGSAESKPYYGFSKLPIGYHEVVCFRIVNNKMYKPDSEKSGLPKCLLVELKDQVLFLPANISKKFIGAPELVEQLNNDKEKKLLFFGGARENK